MRPNGVPAGHDRSLRHGCCDFIYRVERTAFRTFSSPFGKRFATIAALKDRLLLAHALVSMRRILAVFCKREAILGGCSDLFAAATFLFFLRPPPIMLRKLGRGKCAISEHYRRSFIGATSTSGGSCALARQILDRPLRCHPAVCTRTPDGHSFSRHRAASRSSSTPSTNADSFRLSVASSARI